jgi:hypothetical protein
MRYVLSLSILLVVTAAQAQTGQTVPPPPPPQLPPIASTSTACLVNCDTSAMNCLNACVPVGPGAASTLPGAIPNTTGLSGCSNACATQQLVCKQGCTR